MFFSGLAQVDLG